MTKEKKYLNINLDFLEKKSPSDSGPIKKNDNAEPAISQNNKSENKLFTYIASNWKGILVIVGIALFIVWASLSSDSQNVSPSSADQATSVSGSTVGGVGTQEDFVTVGQYRCSSYNAGKADELKPGILEKSQLDTEKQRLDIVASELEQSNNTIDNTYVDQYSQLSVNNYNRLITAHNVKLNAYKADLAAMNNKIDSYNAKTDSYNNYLETNCTKAR